MGALERASTSAPAAAPGPPRLESRRETIRREHADLRRRLEEIDLILARWEAGAEGAGLALRNRGLALFERLRAHIDLEESLLAPVLFASEAGAERALQLAAEHREQRELLAFLRDRMSSPRPTELVVRELNNFLAYLREDMAREEGMLELLDAR
jgi:hemerythrin-like domain-containing protein